MSIYLHQQLSLFAGMGLNLCRSGGQTSAAIPGASMKLSDRAALAARRKLAGFSRLADQRAAGTPVDAGGRSQAN